MKCWAKAFGSATLSSGSAKSGTRIGAMPASGLVAYAISPLDAKVAMADMHFHSIDYHEKAAQEFQDILKEQPANAGAMNDQARIGLIIPSSTSKEVPASSALSAWA